jgi:hypothetical protein
MPVVLLIVLARHLWQLLSSHFTLVLEKGTGPMVLTSFAKSLLLVVTVLVGKTNPS